MSIRSSFGNRDRRAMRARKRAVAGIAVASLFLLGGCGSDDSGSDTNTDTGSSMGSVAVKDDFFEPEEVSVTTGAQVVWTWEGNNPHNVRSDDFESKIQTEGTFEHTFEEAGTFDYICSVHPSMTASIVVTDA